MLTAITLIALATCLLWYGIWRNQRAMIAERLARYNASAVPPVTAKVISLRPDGSPKKVACLTRASMNNGHRDFRTAKCLAFDPYTGRVWLWPKHGGHVFTRHLGSLRPHPALEW